MILAHQGGWDEAALVLAPIALLFLLLWLANRRAKQRPPLDPPPRDPSAGGPDTR